MPYRVQQKITLLYCVTLVLRLSAVQHAFAELVWRVVFMCIEISLLLKGH